jgi:hypothetical protein
MSSWRCLAFWPLCGDRQFMRCLKWIVIAIITGVAGWATGNGILNLIIWLLGPSAAINFSGYHREITPLLIFLATVFGPVTESLAVWVLVWLAQSKCDLDHVSVSLATGAAMVMLHGISWASLAVLPTFAMHAAIMFSARLRCRSGSGYLVIVGAHSLQNLISVIRPRLMA